MSTASSQSPSFYHLSTAEGLSDNNVNIAVRDRNGVLWIATTEGLNSFDGNRITAYHKYKYQELPDNTIERIVIDDQNRIWIRTNTDYLAMLDEKRKFHRILIGDTSDNVKISAIFWTESRGIIVLKGRQHYLQDRSDPKKFSKANLPFDSIMGGSIGFSYYINKDRAIYYRDRKLIVIDYKNMKVDLQLSFPGLNGAYHINDDELLAFTRQGDVFYRISISQKKTVKEYRDLRDQFGQPVNNDLRNMARIDENRFVFTSFFSGLYLLDLSKNKIERWMHDPVDPRSIGGNNTFNVRYDTSGYLFVTTQTSGLHFFNLKQQKATSKPYFIDEHKQVFDGYIQSVYSDSTDNVWMGAQDRLVKWDRKKEKAEYIPLLLPDGTNISGKETIRAVCKDETGRLWVGTSRFGVLVLDRDLKTIVQLTDNLADKRTALPAAWINAICSDDEGNMWAGTLRGTCIINAKDFSIRSLTTDPILGEMSKIPCTTIWNEENGNIWICTTQGAWRYHTDNKKIQHYSTRDGLIHRTVNAVNKDDLENIYFATAGGISILSKEGEWKSYNRSNGLKNDRCEEILKDEKGFMWIGNLNCILRYDPQNKTFAIYEEGLGFSHAGFRMRSSHRNSNGEMFWGTDRGLLYFFPSQMNLNTTQLHPYIHSLQVNDKLHHFTKADKLKFPYNTSSFVFNFSSGELSGDKKNLLQYRLVNFEDDWKLTTATGQAVFSKLPPGNYRFEMRASRDGILWFSAPYPIEINIAAPWWQQTWFRVLLLLVAIGLGWFVFSYFHKKRKTKMALMELNVKMAESRFSNLRLQMNPHFLFNSLSSIQHLIVSQQSMRAYKYLTVFSNFLRSLLNYAEKNFIPLDEEIKILEMYIELESLRFDQSFSWDIQIDEQVSNDEVYLPTLMIQPFVENAIWHGLLHKEGEKRLKIRFENHKEDYLTCYIEDNGIGMDAAREIRQNNITSKVHQSKGISIIRERLTLLEQKTGKPSKLEFESMGEQKGTRVIIEIPYYNPEES